MKSNYMLVVENLIRKDIPIGSVMAGIVNRLQEHGKTTEQASRVLGRPGCKHQFFPCPHCGSYDHTSPQHQHIEAP